jgi:hypothetical protein
MEWTYVYMFIYNLEIADPISVEGLQFCMFKLYYGNKYKTNYPPCTGVLEKKS